MLNVQQAQCFVSISWKVIHANSHTNTQDVHKITDVPLPSGKTTTNKMGTIFHEVSSARPWWDIGLVWFVKYFWSSGNYNIWLQELGIYRRYGNDYGGIVKGMKSA